MSFKPLHNRDSEDEEEGKYGRVDGDDDDNGGNNNVCECGTHYNEGRELSVGNNSGCRICFRRDFNVEGQARAANRAANNFAVFMSDCGAACEPCAAPLGGQSHPWIIESVPRVPRVPRVPCIGKGAPASCSVRIQYDDDESDVEPDEERMCSVCNDIVQQPDESHCDGCLDKIAELGVTLRSLQKYLRNETEYEPSFIDFVKGEFEVVKRTLANFYSKYDEF